MSENNDVEKDVRKLIDDAVIDENGAVVAELVLTHATAVREAREKETEKRLDELERQMDNMNEGFQKKYNIVSKEAQYSSNPREAMHQFIEFLRFAALYDLYSENEYENATLGKEGEVLLENLKNMLDAEEVERV